MYAVNLWIAHNQKVCKNCKFTDPHNCLKWPRFCRAPSNSMGGVYIMGLTLAFIGLLFHHMHILIALFVAVATYIAIFHGDFWYRSFLTLNRDLRWEVFGLREGEREKEGETLETLSRSVRLWSKNWIVVIERMDREGIGKKWEWKWLRYGRNGMDCSGLLLIIRIKIDCWRRLRGNESIDKLWMDVVKRQPNKVRGYWRTRKGNEITGRYDRYRDREKVHFRWI